ncbi:N-acetylneuraminate 9-O-acetyltransferase [Eurytemora carolleeae]|uniref:N-acetylneuraminate 9-O-acetyltransferase n=1 Tax=Eurytemora carolleeae TaxID=1294199 RepID=UPI000C78D89D|nr:N-acetylneuraminate 9-O-acetyltransferase [Eurytemora carolleeae]|eukprot:XP_023335374.1 N-acetylneuraminate 9-O-acetyltransferase-like [Eurytemora affinis]
MTRQDILQGLDTEHLLPTSPPPERRGFSTWSPADYFKLLNITTAKALALILVGGFTVYHSVLHATYDVTPCKGLLKDGMYKGNQWQPWGCMMHKYTRTDSERCFRYSRFWGKSNHFVYVGDSRVHQLYSATRLWLESGSEPSMLKPTAAGQPLSHSVWENSEQNLKLEYIPAPEVDTSMQQALEKWGKASKTQVSVPRRSNGSMDALDEHRRNLTRLKPELENIMEFGGTKVLWALQPPVNSDLVNGTDKIITNDLIWQFNSQAYRVLGKSDILVWSSLYRLVEGNLEEMVDGFHISDLALSKANQMILNLVCNDNMNFNDGSCCKSSDHRTSLQTITFSILAGAVGLSVIIIIYQLVTRRQVSNSRYQSSRPGNLSVCDLPSNSLTNLIFPLARLAVILAYFYVCDRTNFFMKENKYFTPINFWLPVLYMMVVGLFFNEESSYTSVLHVDQTDEWKGWMQMVILVYHMTGASVSIPIYLHIRVLISSYLFLAGYSHFNHFWIKGVGTGISRMLQVLFRMNFLTFVLCLCMNRPYQFYFFVPLVSFWYLVLYCVLISPPVVNNQCVEGNSSSITQYLYVVLKLVALVAVISTLYMSEVFFEKVFVTRPWKALFVTTDDDIHEWWFRWKLDRYSIVYGSLFSLAIIIGGKLKLYDDSNHSCLWPSAIAVPVSIASLIGLGSYTIFSFFCRNKADGNEIHPYISFVPIVSLVILRNMAGFLRSRYSTFFAWFGKISIELFISQYHIWLSADSHGVLVLIPNYPVLNILLTSFIFVAACHEIHLITVQLTPYFVPPEPMLAIRNIIVFVLILVPIGIHDGMF